MRRERERETEGERDRERGRERERGRGERKRRGGRERGRGGRERDSAYPYLDKLSSGSTEPVPIRTEDQNHSKYTNASPHSNPIA